MLILLSFHFMRTHFFLGTFLEEDSENFGSQYTALCMLCDQKGFVNMPDYSDPLQDLEKTPENESSYNFEENKNKSNGNYEGQNNGSARMDDSSTKHSRNAGTMVQCVTCHEYVHTHCLPTPTIQVSTMSSRITFITRLMYLIVGNDCFPGDTIGIILLKLCSLSATYLL